MTCTSTLQRASTALVLIDIQQRLAAAMGQRDAVLDRAVFLTRVAGIVGLPVIVTRQYPEGLGDLEPELGEALGGGPAEPARADKVSFDCFAEPAFVSAVEESGASQLLIAGMETHICVTQTALAGLRSGRDVHVCADACCSRDDSLHALALARLRHAGAVMTCAESAAYELVERAGTPEFKALLAAVKGCR